MRLIDQIEMLIIFMMLCVCKVFGYAFACEVIAVDL